MESERFGYEEVAFSGARNRKPGRFEIADGGTIFLDEVGDLPLAMQPKTSEQQKRKSSNGWAAHAGFRWMSG